MKNTKDRHVPCLSLAADLRGPAEAGPYSAWTITSQNRVLNAEPDVATALNRSRTQPVRAVVLGDGDDVPHVEEIVELRQRIDVLTSDAH